MLKEKIPFSYGTVAQPPAFQPGLTFIETYYSLVKSMIGTGILYFPKAFYLGGVLFSTFLCIMVSILSWVCMRWLSKAHNIYSGTYAEIAEKSLGKFGSFSVNFAVFFTQICPGLVAVGFLITNLSKSLSSFGIEIADIYLMVFFLIILLPLTLNKTISEQTWAYTLASTIIIVNLLVIGIYGCTIGGTVSNLDLVKPSSFFYTFGVVVYGFEGIALVLPIKAEMTQQWDFEKVLAYMMMSLTVLIIWFSVVSVYAYGSSLEDIITLNLPNAYWINALLISYVVAIVLGIPLALFPAFQIMDRMIGQKSDTIRVLLVCTMVLVGYFARYHLGICVSVIGGLLCAPLAFMIPAVINLSLPNSSKLDKFSSWSMILIGLTFGIAAIISTVLEFTN